MNALVGRRFVRGDPGRGVCGRRAWPAWVSAHLAVAVALGQAACKGDPDYGATPSRSLGPVGPSSPGTSSSTESPGSSGTAGAFTTPAGTGGTGAGNAGASSAKPLSSDAGVHATSTSDAGATRDAGPQLAVCAADQDAGADDAGPPPAPRGCVRMGDVRLQYFDADTNLADNQIKPHFNLVNGGSNTLPLTDLTIRYWFTDSGSSYMFSCDYAQIGCGEVSSAFTAVQRTNANKYLEVSFTSGSLTAGAQTGEIQTRFNKPDWSNFDESDDYSCDPSKTSFADWYKVTVYLRGMLVWGAEPL